MIFLQLFWTFFKIGLFGFGGGYGMLSLIQMETVRHHHWLSSADFTNIVAISQMTPGPVGINSATYCGYTAVHNAGMGSTLAVLGSFCSTFALVLPSFVLMIVISKMFMKYMKTKAVQHVFWACAPPSSDCWPQPPSFCSTRRTSVTRRSTHGSSSSASSSSSPPSWAPCG